MTRAWPSAPGVPAAGHVTASGFWHPGKIDGCPKCPDESRWRQVPEYAGKCLVVCPDYSWPLYCSLDLDPWHAVHVARDAGGTALASWANESLPAREEPTHQDLLDMSRRAAEAMPHDD